MAKAEPDSIIGELRGQSIILPDLNAIFDNWPKQVNANLDRLRHDVDEWLDSTMSHNSKIGALKAADFAYFGATWCPQARYDRLRVVTLLAAWLFAWDDEIDMDDGYLWDTPGLSRPYRHETREYVLICLGLMSDVGRSHTSPTNATIHAFEGIGIAIRDAYSYEQCRRLMDHMEDFLEMSRLEQALRLQGTLPSLEEFWSYRLGSSAVHVMLAVNEYAWNNPSLPSSVIKQDDMMLLWKYANIIISTTNDILSLKKEIARGSIGSMIPLQYVQSRNVQTAVDQTTKFLAKTVKAFEQRMRHLLAIEKRGSDEQKSHIDDFIKGCQFYCSGNLTWSLATHRYGIYEDDLAKGIRVLL